MGEKARGERVARALHGAFCRGLTRTALLDLAARKVLAWGPPFVGVYLYLRDQDRLLLAAAAGPGAGTQEFSLATDPWFHASPDAADFGSLIRRHDLILGAIVVSAANGSSFSEAQLAEVHQVADALAVLL